MTTYQCDTCDGETAEGARGSVFIVRPDGRRTVHLCSSACARAYVNNLPQPFPRSVVFVLGIGSGALLSLLAYFLTL